MYYTVGPWSYFKFEYETFAAWRLQEAWCGLVDEVKNPDGLSTVRWLEIRQACRMLHVCLDATPDLARGLSLERDVLGSAMDGYRIGVQDTERRLQFEIEQRLQVEQQTGKPLALEGGG